jgi:hypothetical protein
MCDNKDLYPWFCNRSINDEDAPDIADAFYNHLFKHDHNTLAQPDITKAAEALHLSVKKLRSTRNISFRQWVSFIHLGV